MGGFSYKFQGNGFEGSGRKKRSFEAQRRDPPVVRDEEERKERHAGIVGRTSHVRYYDD